METIYNDVKGLVLRWKQGKKQNRQEATIGQHKVFNWVALNEGLGLKLGFLHLGYSTLCDHVLIL